MAFITNKNKHCELIIAHKGLFLLLLTVCNYKMDNNIAKY